MIYLDNAATSFLKPDCVAEAVFEAMKSLGNSGRGFSGESLAASRVIYDTRCLLAELFDVESPEQVAFTANATEALNTALLGTLGRDGELQDKLHVITTEMEHNSVLRPLYALAEKGVELTILPMDETGCVPAEAFREAIKENTGAIVCTHASNLTGNVNDIHEIGKIAAEHNLLFIVDASQSAGVLPISMKKDFVDILCFSGHKGLMGPQGTGAICVRKGLRVKPLKTGGSGIQTFSHMHPIQMPEALEAGTLNSHGLAGLHAALGWIKEVGREVVFAREEELMQRFYEQVKKIPDVKIYGDFSQKQRVAVAALNIGEYDSQEISEILMEDYGISTRAGGHCAPLMHEALGTRGQGAVRFSFSYFNTEEEIDRAVAALREIVKEG